MVATDGQTQQSGAGIQSRRSTWFRALAWAWAVLWTAFIIALCSIPGKELPDAPFTYFDKVGHFVVFAVLGWAWLTVLGRGVRQYIIVLAGGIVFGALTELYQTVLPWERSADVVDWAFDSAGLIAGWLAWYGWQRVPRYSPPGPAR
jgi:VanZ family protein